MKSKEMEPPQPEPVEKAAALNLKTRQPSSLQTMNLIYRQ